MMEGKCGSCKYAQELERVDEVECHCDSPKTQFAGINPEGRPVSVTLGFPHMSPITGWCHWHEPGEPVKLNRIMVPTLVSPKMVH